MTDRSRSAPTRRHLLLAGGAAAAAAALSPPAPAAARGRALPPLDGARLHRWARDTWISLVAMTDPSTGLPADNIPASLSADARSRYTSPTNVGGYLWSAVAARQLGVISPRECEARVRRTLTTLLDVDHHVPSGMYYNWYDETDGSVVTTWPGSGDPVVPFLSSVDNGWLGAALQVVRTAVPGARDLAEPLWERMRWDAFYDADASRPGGLLHGGFYDSPPPEGAAVSLGDHLGTGDAVWLTDHHYDTHVSEARIAGYLGLVRGQVPPSWYFATWRTFPAGCDWSWQQTRPLGRTRVHEGVEVFEGAYPYRGARVVPGWGGSMFEELMPDLLVPEARWGRRSWGVNHPAHVRAQREHGLEEAGYGYWGFSPSSDPFGDYREYGVDALGLNPAGYLSDRESTNYDPGFEGCREATAPSPTYGDGVVTPHASFLAMAYEPREAQANLVGLEEELGAYGDGGFLDAVAVRSGALARRHLSLDQAMCLGALGNVLGDDVLRRAFATTGVQRALRPLMSQEVFGARLA
ncbi:glucoamylase family protein [uncultured Pseudokineococcus sp.]|uniref:glucoamylase family protein n=1 Tax=uncultured Pseudokineococcus sp. TaxID=1642928 RepID=UPI0026065005|nr:glucoamylase family protein [uncultured Pseudokineococcus sp.]